MSEGVIGEDEVMPVEEWGVSSGPPSYERFIGLVDSIDKEVKDSLKEEGLWEDLR